MLHAYRFALIIAIFSCSLLNISCSSKNSDTSAKPAPGGGPMMVKGVVLKPQVLENIVRSSGTVLASESVDLVAETAGRIDTILASEGAHVRNDELLLKINDDDLQAQLRKTNLQISLAADQEQRQKQLSEKNLISKEQYDITANQLFTLKADFDNLQASIRKKEIRAPFDGIFGLRYVSKGSYVSPTSRIASIQKINPLKVDFSIPEKYAGKVFIGDIIQCKNDELKLQFAGKLYAIEPKIDPATRTVQLRAMCENKSEKIFPGAYVQIDFHLKNIPDAIMVPTQVIIPVLKGQTVLIRRNGIVASVQVQTGIRTPSLVQITNGLAAGDTVITTGILQLRPGMPVNVVVE
ncbi:MAG: efflux RND transporter periplasmic adaptor subunit [Bacteroidota bacterium]